MASALFLDTKSPFQASNVSDAYGYLLPFSRI